MVEGEAANNIKVRSDKNKAFGVIILFGLVSLFGDLAYEGARSVNGPYLKLLAVNAATLGLISGLGELLGYALRLLSGYLADKTKSYWFLTFLGYGMLVSVPLLSLAGVWQVAAVLIIMERIGKAIRSPARDTILSQASSQVGTGFGFGLHEAMDQIGAIIGPLIFSIFFLTAGKNPGIYEYQKGYAFLWIPFLLVMFCLFISYRKVPKPQVLEIENKGLVSDRLSKIFWLYNLFAFFATAGFCSFILVAYHFKLTGFLTDAQIPLFYALAMGVDAVAALVIGKSYDILKDKFGNLHSGLNLLILIPFLSILMLFFIFSSSLLFIIAGLILWGIVMGVQETIMRSAIADTTSLKKRGTGYGIFNTTYGVAIFLGSFLFGLLYDRGLYLVFIGAFILEAAALAVFIFMRKEISAK
ncbi:MAG: MFS transporter [Candidatus Omnitrophica bacterium]|nr:MFS transporter [Candidatus Omnitrophota bacterium]